MLTLEKFEEAAEAVSKVTSETKLVYSEYFSDQTGNKVYLKPENMQYTGAYKVRGAYYKISTLSEEERAKGLINELLRSLDMQYTISHYLRHLYNYAYGELCQSVAKRQPEQMDHASNVLEGLLPSFEEIAKQDDSEAVMKNVQSIYAGLTYGKGKLNESLGMGVPFNRGYEA